MASFNKEWKHCGKELHEFKLTKLEPGRDDEHEDFMPDPNRMPGGSQPKRGWTKKQSEEAAKQEAKEALEKMEAKAIEDDSSK